MILILDTSPICFLVLIGEIEILPRLFPKIVVPRGVLQELRHPGAPAAVREWALELPPWLAICDADQNFASKFDFLDPGEREVIALGHELQPSVVVLDDQVAREEALSQGLQITGLLGILGRAARLELVDLRAALERLQKTHFRVSSALVSHILRQHEERSFG